MCASGAKLEPGYRLSSSLSEPMAPRGLPVRAALPAVSSNLFCSAKLLWGALSNGEEGASEADEGELDPTPLGFGASEGCTGSARGDTHCMPLRTKTSRPALITETTPSDTRTRVVSVASGAPE